jgi:hypothetical protein
MSRVIRSFTDAVALLDRKRVASKLDEELSTAITALENLPGGKGTASITLTLQLAYDDGCIDVKTTVKSKLPEGKAFQDTVFYAHDGGFSLQHPNQFEMDGIREVESPRNRTSA